MKLTIDDKTWTVTRPIKLYDPIYLADVELQFIDCGENLYGRVDRVESEDGRVKYVVSLSNRDDFYTLMHECIHLVRCVFDDRHIDFISENDETIAYYYTWWFKQLWRKCHREEKKEAL